MRKPTTWFPNRSDTNQAIQSQKQVKSLPLKILKEEEEVPRYCPCSENKGADQLTAKLICRLVFAYAECCFSVMV